ncbi:NUDIX domain-containing protein, partial [Bacillus sp. B-TM1]
MGYIEDMRNLVGIHPLILIGSHAIILNKKDEVLLQLRTDFNRWGIIGGALEYNETLEDALKREVFEETGLIIKNPELFRTYSGPDYSVTHSVKRSVVLSIPYGRIQAHRGIRGKYKQRVHRVLDRRLDRFEDALKREVYEETGLIIKNPELFRT